MPARTSALKRQTVIAGYLDYVTHHKDTPGAIDLERTNALKTAGTAYQTRRSRQPDQAALRADG